MSSQEDRNANEANSADEAFAQHKENFPQQTPPHECGGEQGGHCCSQEPPAAESNPADELAEQKDRVLRLQAEIQNLRARQARELTDARQYASIDLLRELLPVVDNIDRALEAGSTSDDSKSLLDGFKLVRQQLVTALKQQGCTEIPADGELFNPDRHQAILQQPSADVPAGKITLVTQAGYQLHDRVVRAAQVIVSSGPVSGNEGIAADDAADDAVTDGKMA